MYSKRGRNDQRDRRRVDVSRDIMWIGQVERWRWAGSGSVSVSGAQEQVLRGTHVGRSPTSGTIFRGGTRAGRPATGLHPLAANKPNRENLFTNAKNNKFAILNSFTSKV